MLAIETSVSSATGVPRDRFAAVAILLCLGVAVVADASSGIGGRPLSVWPAKQPPQWMDCRDHAKSDSARVKIIESAWPYSCGQLDR